MKKSSDVRSTIRRLEVASSSRTKRTLAVDKGGTRGTIAMDIHRQHAQTRQIQRLVRVETHDRPARLSRKGAIVRPVEQHPQIQLRHIHRTDEKRFHVHAALQRVLAPRHRRPVGRRRRTQRRTTRARVGRDDGARGGGNEVLGQDRGDDVGIKGTGEAEFVGGG